MRIERRERGADVLDAAALAEKLSIPPEDLRRRMRLGFVTGFVEAGGRGRMRACVVGRWWALEPLS